MKKIEDLIKEHPFFAELDAQYIATIAGCGKNVIFKQGEIVSHEGQSADMFYVIRAGKVAINIPSPGKEGIAIQTLHEGDVFGFSWIIPPYKWRFDSRAVDETHAVALDGKCLREKCEKDRQMGYELLKRFSSVLAQRLEMTRLQLLDIYGEKTNDSNVHTG